MLNDGNTSRMPIQIHVEPADHATDLCVLMGLHGSDKGNVFNTARHDYTRYYHAVFSQIRESATRVFELGIFGGASLRGWRDYFPKAQIVGADVDPGTLINEDRISSYLCDETKEDDVVRAITSPDGYDVIIDDALHTYEANRIFFLRSQHMLKPGGIYVCEDLPAHEVSAFHNWANSLREQGWAAHVVSIPRVVDGEDIPDNSLLVMRRP